jgi:hypothetical protein
MRGNIDQYQHSVGYRQHQTVGNVDQYQRRGGFIDQNGLTPKLSSKNPPTPPINPNHAKSNPEDRIVSLVFIVVNDLIDHPNSNTIKIVDRATSTTTKSAVRFNP